MALVLHKAVTGAAPGTKSFFFLAPKGAYVGIGTECGIDEAAEADDDEPAIPVKNLLGNGILIRIVVRYTVGTKKKTARVLCVKENLATALSGLDGNAYNGGTIKSAGVPRSMSFY